MQKTYRKLIDFNNFKKNLVLLADNTSTKKFLLAVSGGADSMVLLHLFRVSGLEFHVAHINYHFRGEDSNLDQKVAEDFCKKHHLKFHLKDVSEKEKSDMKSLQNWAREIRYDFFFNILEKEKIDYIVTAHHLNDELETFIINLSRGSGIKGLSGIPKNENQILRPFLNYTKEEIYAYAKENNLDFREDKSNKKDDYLRNKIRNHISPKLIETQENFLINFGKSLSYLHQTKNFVEEKIEEIFHKISSENNQVLVIDKSKLFAESDFVRFEILRKFGFEDEKEILKITKAETGKVFHSKKYTLIIERKNLTLTKKTAFEKLETDNEIILPQESEINLNDFIDLDNLNDFSHKSEVWKFDTELLKFPLKLRKKQDGDLFFPVKMKGSKKIGKFLKDKKIPILVKEKLWLLCDAENQVLGIIPYRQDRRYMASPETEKTTKINI